MASAGSDSSIQPKVVASEASPLAEPAPVASPIVNPTLRLEPALGLVVIEFRNDSGAITTSIPSQRQIEAYQRWETTRIGPRPAGQPAASPGARVAESGTQQPAVLALAKPDMNEGADGGTEHGASSGAPAPEGPVNPLFNLPAQSRGRD